MFLYTLPEVLRLHQVVRLLAHSPGLIFVVRRCPIGLFGPAEPWHDTLQFSVKDLAVRQLDKSRDLDIGRLAGVEVEGNGSDFEVF